jgi:hypothetical protein
MVQFCRRCLSASTKLDANGNLAATSSISVDHARRVYGGLSKLTAGVKLFSFNLGTDLSYSQRVAPQPTCANLNSFFDVPDACSSTGSKCVAAAAKLEFLSSDWHVIPYNDCAATFQHDLNDSLATVHSCFGQDCERDRHQQRDFASSAHPPRHDIPVSNAAAAEEWLG